MILADLYVNWHLLWETKFGCCFYGANIPIDVDFNKYPLIIKKSCVIILSFSQIASTKKLYPNFTPWYISDKLESLTLDFSFAPDWCVSIFNNYSNVKKIIFRANRYSHNAERKKSFNQRILDLSTTEDVVRTFKNYNLYKDFELIIFPCENLNNPLKELFANIQTLEDIEFCHI